MTESSSSIGDEGINGRSGPIRRKSMATMTTVSLVDDLDGSAAAETVAFSLDGANYEIDLTDKNAKKLRDALSGYVANARRIDGGRRVSSPRGAKAKPAKAAKS